MRTCSRLLVLIAALAFSLASAGGNKQTKEAGPAPQPGGDAPPVSSQPMAESSALGLWKSSFGAVKVERDPGQSGTIRGIWLYERNGDEVIGYFTGGLSGNTLSFSWEEPSSGGAPLVGGGYLVFDPQGQSFRGKWWTTNRDRGGDWSGWRAENAPRPDSGPAEQAPREPGKPLDEPPPPPPPAEGNDDGGDFI